MSDTAEFDRKLEERSPLKLDPEAWYTPEQLCRLIPWSPATLAFWRCNGQGPEYTKVGRRILYLGADVASFIGDRKRQSTAENNDPPKPVGRFPRRAA